MLSTFSGRAVIVLELAQPLTSTTGGFAVGTVIAQSANQRAHFLLAITNGALQPLPPLLLMCRGLLLLLLPALEQFVMEQFCPGQKSSSVFSGRLLALALLFQTTDHGVDITVTTRGQQRTGPIEHLSIQAKTCRNGQSIAAPWNSPQQCVGG